MLPGKSLHVVSILLCIAVTGLAQEARECEKWKNGTVREAKNREYCWHTRGAKMFWASSLAPIATNLPADGRNDVRFFMSHMQYTGRLAVEKRAADFLRPVCPYPKDGSMSVNQKTWLISGNVYVQALDYPDITSYCLTSVSTPASNARKVIAHLRNLNRVMDDTGQLLAGLAQSARRKSFVDGVIERWRKVVGYFQASVDDSVFKCTVLSIVGIRKHGQWGISVKLTNDALNVSRPPGERIYLSEILTISADKGLHAVHVSSFKEGQTDHMFRNTTTTITGWAGRPQITEFFQMAVEDVPALSRLLEQTKKDKDLVLDTVFGSNIAILVLPIFMTLVPISFFDYVNTPGMLLYALFTDIFSTLPLFVKGIELLSFPDRAGCESWVQGIEAVKESSTAIIETWCTSCEPKKSFRIYGYAFLVVSIFFMVLGVAAEIYARCRLLDILKKTDKLPRRYWSWAEKNSNDHPNWISPPYPACKDCTCNHEPRSWTLDKSGLRVSNIEDVVESNTFLPLGSRRLQFFAKSDA